MTSDELQIAERVDAIQAAREDAAEAPAPTAPSSDDPGPEITDPGTQESIIQILLRERQPGEKALNSSKPAGGLLQGMPPRRGS
ncbi:hypothetical protein [Pseudarthrobacter sp. Y6]|uniref:hypothetical protein n=1 Tax=Pseudarthrobacter sp. Y6 TaxID=3418422 RepID=UPI003CF33FC4